MNQEFLQGVESDMKKATLPSAAKVDVHAEATAGLVKIEWATCCFVGNSNDAL